jgi:hypothetical protein
MPPDPQLTAAVDSVLRISRRSRSTRMARRDGARLRKVFRHNAAGRACFRNEREANRIFSTRSWFVPWTRRGWHWFERPLLPEECRLDRLAPRLGAGERRDLAERALMIVLDIYAHGYVHRDFHAQNLFRVNDQLKLVDFETLIAYPPPRPPFRLSYDVTGQGLESPLRTGHMGFAARHESGQSVCQVLGVELEPVLAGLPGHLKEAMRGAALSFKSRKKRHACRAERIYSTFSLPGLTVEPREAQRNSARRLEQFGIGAGDLRGRRILDLGCNMGAMLFEAQKHRPGACLGVEFDGEKVAVARMIAAYCGLGSITFRAADIDRLSRRSLEGPFDVVFCLAVEGHIRRPQRMYSLLGKVAREVVYFEGNSSTGKEAAERGLRSVGFTDVRYIGVCDDDCLDSNNVRPLLVARR